MGQIAMIGQDKDENCKCSNESVKFDKTCLHSLIIYFRKLSPLSFLYAMVIIMKKDGMTFKTLISRLVAKDRLFPLFLENCSPALI